MDITTKEDLTIKEIYDELSKPLKFFIAATGINFCVVIFFVVAVMSPFFKESEGTWNIIRVVFFILLLLQYILTITLAAITLLELIRLKWHSARIKDCGERCVETYQKYADICPKCTSNSSMCAQNLNKINTEMRQVSQNLSHGVGSLNAVVRQMTLADNILDEKEIVNLESSAAEGEKIVVMTTKFHLDIDKLVQVILDNIRKGAIYEYLIPSNNGGTGVDQQDFMDVYTVWWKEFIQNLFSLDFDSPESNKYSKEYRELRRKAISMKEHEKSEIIEEAKKYFKKHVKEYDIKAEYSLVTIIMYQKGRASSREWETIIKLPTTTDDNYYAFRIPKEEYREKENLIRGIRSFCKPENLVELTIDD